MLSKENGTLNGVDFISRFMQRPWDRTAMQILPRREGDLEMQEGSLFKTWTRCESFCKPSTLNPTPYAHIIQDEDEVRACH